MNPSIGLCYLSLAGAQAVIAINVVLAKYVLDFMPIYTYLTVRFFISTLGLSFIFLCGPRKVVCDTHPNNKLTFLDWLLLIAQGLLGGLLFNYFFIWGLEYTTATSAGIIASALPVIIALSAWLFLKERVSFPQKVALLLATLGIVLINVGDPSAMEGLSGHAMLGSFLVLLAMFPEAWYSIIGKFISRRVEPLAGAMIVNAAATVFFIPFALNEGSMMHLGQWDLLQWLLVTIAGISSLLFFWLWPVGLRSVSTVTASLFGSVMPVVVSLLAMLFLGEQCHLVDLLGMFLIFLSIWVGAKGSLFGWSMQSREVGEES